MLTFKLALRNLLGAGMRTWLNVVVLSISFVIIILNNGIIDGWNQQARTDTIHWEYGNGQLWQKDYDPYDPFALQDAHAPLPEAADKSKLVPELVIQASIYPQGRMQTALLKGIPADQKVLALPTASLDTTSNAIPAIIGKRMAKTTKLTKGDKVLIRWRDKNGTFDATEIAIAHVFDTNVPSVDNGQIWIALDTLQQMTGLTGQATLLVAAGGYQLTQDWENWNYKDLDFLLADLDNVIQAKKASGSIIYMLLLAIALLAIFDTQVLSVFRRQKEIGTYIALGMTRSQVVGLFTAEGGANSLLAAVVGSLYGIPVFIYMVNKGIAMPAASDKMGISIAERIFPTFGAGLILGTVALIVIAATIVSFLPAKKIAQMNPTDALKGKLQ